MVGCPLSVTRVIAASAVGDMRGSQQSPLATCVAARSQAYERNDCHRTGYDMRHATRNEKSDIKCKI